MEFESVTTKGGDRGFTSLYDGQRVRKNSPIISFLNVADSLNAAIALVRSDPLLRKYDKNVLAQIQTDLYEIMGKESGFPTSFTQDKVDFLERKERLYMKFTKIPRVFINFGDNAQSASLNSLRCTARSIEIVYLSIPTDPVIMQYFNRLSDLFYIMSLVYEFKAKKELNLLQSSRKNVIDFFFNIFRFMDR